MAMTIRPCVALLLAALLLATPAAASFVTFETGQVRPLALSLEAPPTPPAHLYAVNTPDGRLEIFDIDSSGSLTRTGSVPVGMEPSAVAVAPTGAVWVVNHLSDSVSIVDVSTSPPRVTATLLVGDEPRDIVFASGRAFITTAHRGQNSGVPLSDLTTPGIGRADVWVFDSSGNQLTVITLFGDTPRALAVSPDGSTVYAAVFDSGNQTTTLSEGVVCNDTSSANNVVAPSCTVSEPAGNTVYPGGLPNPDTNLPTGGTKGPETGLVVKFDGAHWSDTLGRNWDNGVRFSLPDDDVFRIDATANPVPVPKPSVPIAGQPFAHVGTVLFNMAVNPVSGKVYVTNGDANNLTRFEGPGGGGSTVRGHLHEARVTILDPAGGTVTPRRLNPHIDYSVVPSPPGTSAKSLATPLGMAVSGKGATLYVAAFGSSKVGVLDVAQLETNPSYMPDTAQYITVSGGGPSGLALDEVHGRLYVLTRFDNAVSAIDVATHTEAAHLPLHNPEPDIVKNGRSVLYDAVLTSSNGEAACASCHIFGDFDSLAWDLGNPDGIVLKNCNPFRVGPFGSPDFHPLKGPMTTQSLRGMANAGPMHWRGDRNGKTNQDTGQCDASGDPLSEDQAFKKFIVAFDGLLGRGSPITDTDMQRFTDFILQVTYPPNPVRNLDNSLTPDQKAGRDFFMNITSDTLETCNGCHHLDPSLGFFGTDGFSSFENETQHVKIPHLRNLYQKVGMFGMPGIAFINNGNNGGPSNGTPGPASTQAAQVRGFGFLHDGSVDTLLRFHNATVFNGGFTMSNCSTTPDTCRRQVEQFMLAFDSNLAPIVGQQVTLTGANGGTVGSSISTMITRASLTTPECDLIVKGNHAGAQRGWLLDRATMKFQTDATGEAEISDTALRNQAATMGEERTYTCVPPGSGVRMGIDRDEDGFPDFTEVMAGSDPADPNSVPGGSTTTTTFPPPPPCTTVPVTDPDAAVKVATRNGAGQLKAKMNIALSSYGGENVTVTLSDADTPTIATQTIGPLPPAGTSGTKFRFRTTADGVQRVELKNLAPKQPGTFRLTVKTKRWFTAAAANQPATSTDVTVQIGTLCFPHAATKKID
jgi:YVTN family beta-propeller protein